MNKIEVRRLTSGTKNEGEQNQSSSPQRCSEEVHRWFRTDMDNLGVRDQPCSHTGDDYANRTGKPELKERKNEETR